MDAAIQAKLREKFDVKHIGLKPKITCQACSKSFGKACEKHQKAKCERLRGEPGCGQWITPQHMHIEFVGHANVTDRLLEVDPEWTWEPVAYGADGLPALTSDGGLWIRLTVAGVTRIGYGGADGKTGDDAVKEAVSDALKTTAMRFGVGLDLWRKEEASGKTADESPAEPQQHRNSTHQATPAPIVSKDAKEALEELAALCDAMNLDREMVAAEFARRHNGADVRKAATPEAAGLVRAFIAAVDDMDPTKLKKSVAAANGAAT